MHPYGVGHFQFWQGFWLACRFKLLRDSASIRFPEPFGRQNIDRGQVERLVSRVAARVYRRVAAMLWFTTRRCFFQAYTAAYILHKNGVPVVMNMGLHPLHERPGNMRGHCWLTYNGRPLAETGDPAEQYSRYLGAGTNGIRYWIGSGEGARRVAQYRKS